jgi:hypothetical protein
VIVPTLVAGCPAREPVEKGGWSVFHTWFTGGFTLNPVVSAPLARRRITVWQVEASHNDAADRRFDVAAVRVIGIARYPIRIDPQRPFVRGSLDNRRAAPFIIRADNTPERRGSDAASHRDASMTKLYDRCGYNPEKAISFIATY